MKRQRGGGSLGRRLRPQPTRPCRARTGTRTGTRIYLIADAACSIYPSVCQCLQFSSSEHQRHKWALDSSGALLGATLATATGHANELAGFHGRSFAAQLPVRKLEDSRLTPRFKLANRASLPTSGCRASSQITLAALSRSQDRSPQQWDICTTAFPQTGSMFGKQFVRASREHQFGRCVHGAWPADDGSHAAAVPARIRSGDCLVHRRGDCGRLLQFRRRRAIAESNPDDTRVGYRRTVPAAETSATLPRSTWRPV